MLTGFGLFCLATVTDTGEVVKSSTRPYCCKKSTSRMTCEMSCFTTMKLFSGTFSMPLSFTAALTLFTMGSSSPPSETSLSVGVSPKIIVPLKRLAISCMPDKRYRGTRVQHYLNRHPSYQSLHNGDVTSDGCDKHCFERAYWRTGCLLPSADTLLEFSWSCSPFWD